MQLARALALPESAARLVMLREEGGKAADTKQERDGENSSRLPLDNPLKPCAEASHLPHSSRCEAVARECGARCQAAACSDLPCTAGVMAQQQRQAVQLLKSCAHSLHPASRAKVHPIA